ncbi:MAG: helix-turn-helix transcriptional regulator [Clostridia bacterium]|nr:helix-turn-helix transcriptional regulator [Clostridia bacterium]
MFYEKLHYAYAGRFHSRKTWIHPRANIPTWEIIYVTAGKVCIEENGVRYALAPGEIILLQPDIPHEGYESSDDVDFIWMHFSAENCEDLPEPLENLHSLHLTDTYPVDLLSRQLLHYAESDQYPAEACDYLIRLILMEILRQKPHKDNDNSHAAAAMEQWINANLYHPVTVHEIASRSGYSDDHAERIYKKNFGVSMKKAITDKKMRNIKSVLLTSDLPLARISTMFGFGDCRQFLKFFRYHEGVSPTVFRRLYYKMHCNTNDREI